MDESKQRPEYRHRPVKESALFIVPDKPERDETRKHQLGEHCLAFPSVLHEAQEKAIGFKHASLMDQCQPMIEAFPQWLKPESRVIKAVVAV